MQAQLSANAIIPSLNGVQGFPNWNWNMQTLPPAFLGAPVPSNYSDLGFCNFNMQGNFGDSGGNSEKETNRNGKEMNENFNMSYPFPQQMAFFPEQASLMQQQGMANKMNVFNPLMFQNLGHESLVKIDSKSIEVPTSVASFGINMNNDISNSVPMKKERLSPLPFLFSGPCQAMPNYMDPHSSNPNILSDSLVQSNNINQNSFASSSQPISSTSSVSCIGGTDTKDNIMPTPPQTPPFYPLPNPMQNFWGNNFMCNNPSSMAPFFNHLQPFGGPPSLINPSQIIGNPFRFPNTPPFNPFLPSPEMAATAAFQNGYIPPNFQHQQNLFQQQQQEQFLALANQHIQQQQQPVIKQENDVPFEACPTPKREAVKLEDDHSSSSYTDEEGTDKLIKPRKSSKCQCPNCTNPQPEDESAKLIKKHACHWPGCPKTYGKTSHLKSHIRQHQGIRPFICPDQTCMKVIIPNIFFRIQSRPFFAKIVELLSLQKIFLLSVFYKI